MEFLMEISNIITCFNFWEKITLKTSSYLEHIYTYSCLWKDKQLIHEYEMRVSEFKWQFKKVNWFEQGQDRQFAITIQAIYIFYIYIHILSYGI